MALTLEEPYISECLSVSLYLAELFNSNFRAQYISTLLSDSAKIWHTYQPQDGDHDTVVRTAVIRCYHLLSPVNSYLS